jgi:glycosyltransferase involved in cell wall biosynthesis
MRIIAIIATYNEERFIEPCLEHLIRNGIEVYLCDNESNDQTVELAQRYLGRGLFGLETIPRNGMIRTHALLLRKEELAQDLDGDWFMHLDPDEFRLPPRRDQSLAEAIASADAAGYSAVNFLEFTFIPTVEEPDHDHTRFLETMRWYYPFLPYFPHRLNAWKKQSERVDLAGSAGHQVRFPGLRVSPESFRMRHYLYLSRPQALRKYYGRICEPKEIQELGWHDWRVDFQPDMARLAPQAALRRYTDDDSLDPSCPRRKHFVEEPWLNM